LRLHDVDDQQSQEQQAKQDAHFDPNLLAARVWGTRPSGFRHGWFSEEKRHNLLYFERGQLRHVCIKVLTKSNGHGSCRVVGKIGDPCDGTPKAIDLSDYQMAIAGGSAAESSVPNPGDQAGNAAQSAPPATVEAVLKKSWQCMTSLFKEC
jgi:hypothetical protein